MFSGKCPKCDRFVSNANLEYIDINVNYAPTWKGVSYLCSFCSCILSVGIDPIAIKNDMVDELFAKLRRG